MAKLTKETAFKPAKPRNESVMDKTSRAVKEILDEETTQRETRTARLRKARLEREAGTPPASVDVTPAKATRKPRTKTTK